MSQRSDNVVPRQDLTYVCPCGKVHLVKGVRHYDRILLSCKRPVWAIQPKRNGPLELRKWPGPALTARELAEKEASERLEAWKAGRFTA